MEKKSKIFFNNKSRDKRNYYVISKNFKKYFSRDFKFTNFTKEVISLLKLMKEFKIKLDNQTVRIKFYKKLFKFNN